MLRILTSFGTRSEIIEPAPVLRALDAPRQVLSECGPGDAVEPLVARERKRKVLTTYRRAGIDSRARRVATVPGPFGNRGRGSRIFAAIDRWLGANAVAA